MQPKSAESKQLQRLRRIRSEFLVDEPFFGHAALRLDLVEDPQCRDVWTNAVALGFNPQYIDGLLDIEFKGALCAAVLSIVAGHPWRQDSRDPTLWQRACGLVTNPQVIEAGYTLPPNALYDEDFAGKSAEFTYDHLEAEQQANQPEQSNAGQQSPEGESPQEGFSEPSPEASDAGEGSGTEERSGSGGATAPREFSVEIRPAPIEQPGLEEDWKSNVKLAHDFALAHGHMSANVSMMVDGMLQSKTSWREVLWSFIEQAANNTDYTFAPPSLRYQHLGFYMPSLRGERVGTMVLVRDTSSSIFQKYRELINGELDAIFRDVKPSEVVILDVDSSVKQVQHLQHDELDEMNPHTVGGGGTSFCPAFDYIAQEGIEPVCLVYLTDLLGDFPEEPDYPVIWAVPEGSSMGTRPPFGEFIEVESE